MTSLPDLIRAGMKEVKTPGAYDRVYKDECVFSMVDVFTPAGLFTNLKTWHAVGERFVKDDCEKTGNSLYYVQKFKKIPREKKEGEDVVLDGKDHDVEKEFYLAVVDKSNLGSEIQYVQFPFKDADDVPMLVSQCFEAVNNHAGLAAQAQLSAWQDDEIKVSKYADNLVQVSNPAKVSNNPKDWKCQIHGELYFFVITMCFCFTFMS